MQGASTSATRCRCLDSSSNELAMFLRNSWYVAAWDWEISRQPRARTFLDQPVVLYRKEDGTPVALEDRCCHRQLPLWMGNPAKADPTLIPDWWWANHPDWAFSRPEMIHVKANYQLISDNVLDVTHLAYVHATSIGASSITEFPATTEREERLVRLTRWIIDRPPPPLYRKAGGFPGNVERWQIVEHVPPCFSVNFAGCKDAERRIDLMALSAPTPETGRTTHYFFGFVRNFGLRDPEMDKIFGVDMVTVFNEDIPILEAQQRNLELRPDAPRIDIKVDAAPLAARRMLEAMIQREADAVTCGVRAG